MKGTETLKLITHNNVCSPARPSLWDMNEHFSVKKKSVGLQHWTLSSVRA